MLGHLFLTSLETVINQYLRLDPESFAKISAFKSQTLAICIPNIPFTCFIQFADSGICLSPEFTGRVNTTITTDIYTLIKLAMQPNQANNVMNDMEIKGDVELAQKLKQLFDNIHIDWEEYLAHWIGDIPAHHLGDSIRKTKAWCDETSEHLQKNFSEYLQEETGQLPPRLAVEDFLSDVDKLRSQADRLEARLNNRLKL